MGLHVETAQPLLNERCTRRAVLRIAHASHALLFDSPAGELRRYADNFSNGTKVTHYTKLALLLLRSMGIVMLVYASPMVVWGLLKGASGATTASDGTTNLRSVVLAWGMYAVAGLLLLLLARPFAHVAAHGLDDSITPRPPA